MRLNYHHLYYFWMVAKEGSIARASEELRVAQPTISSQIRQLEDSLGEPLFTRVGRGLMLTEPGHVAFRYANEIFLTGQELVDTLRGRPSGRPLRLEIGISYALPKLVARWLLEPVLAMAPPVRVVCREDATDRLLGDLSRHALDVVIADDRAGASIKVKVFNHLLGESGLTFFGTHELAARLRPGFPRSLDGAPMLLQIEGTSVRRSLEQWFDGQALRPEIVAEFQDSALLKEVGRLGAGVFAAPTVVEDDIRAQHQVEVIGRIDELRERFYAISVERKVKHPAVIAICDMARRELEPRLLPRRAPPPPGARRRG